MIINGQNADESDFINEIEKDVTPGDDAGRVVKLEADGRLGVFFTRNGAIVDAGETINGATSPVPIYISKADGEAYACDANDTNKYKFASFAISNSTDGNPIKVQGSGVVSGFSGLSTGEKYYVQDTAGTIGTTPGTMEILVGVAISSTQLLIQKGRRNAHGTVSQSDTGTGPFTHAITLGFRPSLIRIRAFAEDSAANDVVMHSVGSWRNGTYAEVHAVGNGSTSVLGTGSSGIVNLVNVNGTTNWTATITSVTDTGFTISLTEVGTLNPINLHWEAEGEI